MTTAPILSAEGIQKTYKNGKAETSVLHGITLSILQGTATAIVGKSGSGKSTLMHILSSLDNKYEGRVKFDGTNLRNLKPDELDQVRERAIGFVFQTFYLQPNMSVLDNTALPLEIAGIGKKERLQKAEQALADVGLAEKLAKKASDLSGGEKQRVCIARAIVNSPKLIFADEPTGNLDSKTGAQIVKLLFSLKDKGATLVIVTHDEDLAKKCDRQIRLQDGSIV